MFDKETLAIIYVGLLALTVLLYAILDGYDLGVGMLMPLNNDEQADTMIASIGPFWDANETWLVMAVGLLLIAFPEAHSIVFKALYIPTLILLISLILRGIAFDFRAKAVFTHKPLWDKAFKFGSLVASLSQGYMLGQYIVGFDQSLMGIGFSLLSAVGVAIAYTLIGAAWLVMKCEGELQIRAIRWFHKAIYISGLGVLAVSLVNPLANGAVFERWLSSPIFWMLPIICAVCFALALFEITKMIERKNIDINNDIRCWTPFLLATTIFLLCFGGIGLSFYPYIVPNQLSIWDAVAAPQSLNFLLWGAMVVIPTIIAYTVYSYKVFWGKVSPLQYY